MTTTETELKTMSQIENGSPAQIWTYDSDLAEVIFGSLEEARIYGEKCDELATRSCAASGLPEVHVLSARGATRESGQC